MTRFSKLAGLLAGAACLTVLGMSDPARAEFSDRTIRISVGITDEHPQAVAMRRFSERLAELSGGKMKATVYANAVLGNDASTTQMLRGGTLEMNGTSTSPLSQMRPELGVFDFPFLFNTEQEADAVLDGAVGKYLEPKFLEMDLVLLCWMENGFRNLTNSEREVATAEDLKGLKLRVMQNSIFLDAFAQLGANPMAMAFSEVFPALETGAIDAQENPNVTVLTSRFYEVQDYLSTTRHVYTPFVTLVSKKFWDKLSGEEQQAMQTACNEARDFQRKLIREEDVKALEQLKEEGMTITQVSEEERAKMREITRPTVEKYTQQVGPDFVKMVMSEIEKVRGQAK